MNTQLRARTIFAVAALALALSLSLIQTAQAETAPTPAPTLPVYQKTLQATGFVVIPKDSEKLGYGSCWIVDHTNRLVITNVHVVTIFDNVRVTFPRYANGEVVANSAKYGRNDYINGKVLARDSKRDLALIQLDQLPQGTRALELAPAPIAPGSRVFAIGNAGMAGKPITGGTLWSGRQGTVQKSMFFTTLLNGTEQRLETRVIATNSGTKPGDSGGPMVDEQGRLVGVTSCSNDKGDYAVDVNEVRTFIARSVPAAKAAPPTRGLYGTWTLTWKIQDRSCVAGLTLNANGTGSWDGSKLCPGTFTFTDGKLVLNMPGAGVHTTSALVWDNNDTFRFTVQFSDGPVDFKATRR